MLAFRLCFGHTPIGCVDLIVSIPPCFSLLSVRPSVSASLRLCVCVCLSLSLSRSIARVSECARRGGLLLCRCRRCLFVGILVALLLFLVSLLWTCSQQLIVRAVGFARVFGDAVVMFVAVAVVTVGCGSGVGASAAIACPLLLLLMRMMMAMITRVNIFPAYTGKSSLRGAGASHQAVVSARTRLPLLICGLPEA